MKNEIVAEQQQIINLSQSNKSVLAVALAGFSAFLHLYSTQSLLPYFTKLFHASKVEVSLSVSATTIAVALSAPFIGLLADLVGRKQIIVGAVLGLSVPTFLVATASGLDSLIGWRFVQGLFMPAIFAVTMAYISEEWQSRKVGSVMSVYVTGNILGGVLGRFLAGIIAVHFSWRGAFVVLGCLNFATGALIWAWLPRAQNFKRQQNIGTSVAAITKHLRNPPLLAAYAVGFNVLFSNVSTFTYVNFYLAAAPFHLNTVALGSIFFVYLLGVIVTPIAGKWLDRLGYRLVLAAAILTSSLGLLLTLIPQLWLVIIGLAICSSGVFVCQSAAKSYVGITAGQARSSATGLYVACFYLGGSMGAIVPGFVWSFGGWNACVALIIAVQILTATIALCYWNR
jgi:MFS transporter, YNFM family, putative membrane transport protein